MILRILIVIFLISPIAYAQSRCEDELSPKLAQMFYVWAKNSGPAADPAFLKFVHDFQPGGILLSGYGPGQTLDEAAKIISDYKQQFPANSLAPLVGADYLFIKKPVAESSERESAQNFGMGTNVFGGFDFMDLAADVRKICIRVLSEIKAIAHRVVGMNHPLGPIVEEKIDPDKKEVGVHQDETNFLSVALSENGVIPTLKHYPFTVKGTDYHKQSLEIDLTPEQVLQLQKNFLLDNDTPHVVMTTHAAVNAVDGGNLATFSSDWIGRLRKTTGPDNLIMTDGLFMIGNYSKQLARLSGLDPAVLNKYSSVEFDTGKGKEKILVPWIYNYDPCFVGMKNVIRKYEKTDISVSDALASIVKIEGGRAVMSEDFEHKSRKRIKIYEEARAEIANKMRMSPDEVSQKCDFKIIDYVNMVGDAKGEFRVDEVPRVANQVFGAFAEKAIMAGHDLILMEGSPQITKATHATLLKKACSTDGQELKSRIEDSYSRIERFKQKNRIQLAERASEDWIKKNQPLLDRLFFRIYPAINNPRRPCGTQHLEAAKRTIKELCK